MIRTDIFSVSTKLLVHIFLVKRNLFGVVMIKPVYTWTNTFIRTGWKVVRRFRKKASESVQEIPNDALQVENLEERQMLSGSLELNEGQFGYVDPTFTVTDIAGEFRILVDQGDGSAAKVVDDVHITADGGSFKVSAEDVAIKYADDGNFNLQYYLERDGVVEASQSVDANILDVPAVIEVGVSQAEVTIGEDYEVHFSANDPGDDLVQNWIIDWGDGNSEQFGGSVNSASHRYESIGDFSIQVSAIDENGDLVYGPASLNSSLSVSVGLDSSFGTDGTVEVGNGGNIDQVVDAISGYDSSVILTGGDTKEDFESSRVSFSFGGAESFSYIGRKSFESDQFYAVDVNENYKISASVISGDGAGGSFNPNVRHYLGVKLYDSDKRPIWRSMFQKVPGSNDTFLAADLNPGDTHVTLVDASGWYDGTNNALRTIAWYTENDKQHEYTRNYKYAGLKVGGRNGNVIELETAWNGPALKAGDAVRNASNDGGTFHYNLLYSKTVSGESVQHLSADFGNFFKGDIHRGLMNEVAFVKPIVLANYTGGDGTNQLNISNVSIVQTSIDKDDAFRVKEVLDGPIDLSIDQPIVGRISVRSSTVVAVDPDANYRLKAELHSGDSLGSHVNPAARHYVGFAPLDVDMKTITPYHFSKVPGSTDTRLAVDLKPGDTEIVLQDATGWDDLSLSDRRTIAWYGYSDSTGNVYDDWTYTRNYRRNLWDEGAINGNVIQLRTAWTGPEISSGTAVRNTRGGNTYNYALLSNSVITQDGVSLESEIGGNYDPESTKGFRIGTKYIQALVWANYINGEGNQLNVDSFSIERVGHEPVLSKSTEGSESYFVERKTALGETDSGFVGANSLESIFPKSSSFNTEGFGIVETSDGKYIAAGMIQQGKSADIRDLVFVRLNSDGTVDSTFGGDNGYVQIETNGRKIDKGIQLKVHNGQLYVLGRSFDLTDADGHWEGYVQRFSLEGVLDSSFGTDGRFDFDFAGSTNDVLELSFDSAGNSIVGLSYYDAQDGWNQGLVRITTNGVLDTTFGPNGDGKVSFDYGAFGAKDSFDSIVVHGSHILTSGSYENDIGQSAIIVNRYLMSGTLDTSFGDNGSVRIDFSAVDKSTGLAVQSDGKIVVLGTVEREYGPEKKIYSGVTRLNADGTIDLTFGASGQLVLDLAGKGGSAAKILVNQNDEVIISGVVSSGESAGSFVLKKLAESNTVKVTVPQPTDPNDPGNGNNPTQDWLVGVSVTDNQATEGDPSDLASFSINRTGTPAYPNGDPRNHLVVNFLIDGPGITDSDYKVTAPSTSIWKNSDGSYSLLFPSWSVTDSIDLNIEALHDNEVESDETFSIRILEAKSDQAIYEIDLDNEVVSGTLVDNGEHQNSDSPWKLRIDTVDATAAETESGQASDTGMVRVSRTGGSDLSEELTFQIAANGVAVLNEDYDLAANPDNTIGFGWFKFLAGQEYIDIEIVPIDDNTEEITEQVMLGFFWSPNYEIDTENNGAFAIVNIEDNDTVVYSAPWKVKVEALESSFQENGPTLADRQTTFEFTRTHTSLGNVTLPPIPGQFDGTVVYFDVSGSAIEGIDYKVITDGTTVWRDSQNGYAAIVNSLTNKGAVTLEALDDSVVESLENVVITIREPQGQSYYEVDSDGPSASVDLIDDDTSGGSNDIQWQLSIESIDSTAAETTVNQSANTAVFRVTRSGSSDYSQALNFTVSTSGAATFGTDYELVSANQSVNNPVSGTSFQIPEGEQYVDIILRVVDDFEIEGTESATVSISPGSYGVNSSASSSSINISDNESSIPGNSGKWILKIEAIDPDAAEVAAGLAEDEAAFRVTRYGLLDNTSDLAFQIEMDGVAVYQTDYELEVEDTTSGGGGGGNPPGPGSLPPGPGGGGGGGGTGGGSGTTFDPNNLVIKAHENSVIIKLKVTDDSLVEGVENAVLRIKEDTAYVRDTSSLEAEATIQDDDQSTPVALNWTVGVEAIDAVATENADPEADKAIFRVYRAGETDLTQELKVYLKVDGKAESNDFSIPDLQTELLLGQPVSYVVIAAGSDYLEVEVKATDDQLIESVEDLSISILESSFYSIDTDDSSVNLSILDNDRYEYKIETIDGIASESDSSNEGSFRVTKTGTLAGNHSDNGTVYFYSSGVAESGSDFYLTGSGVSQLEDGRYRIQFAPNSSSVDVSLVAKKDDFAEGLEEATFELAAGYDYQIDSIHSSASISVHDNDDWTINVETLDSTAGERGISETDDNATFRITRSGTGSLNSYTRVHFSLSGTADLDTDYKLFANGNLVLGNYIDFGFGEDTVDLELVVVNDYVKENEETFSLQIQARSTYRLGANDTVSATISDNDSWTVKISSQGDLDATESVDQAPDTATFRITRYGQTDNSNWLRIKLNIEDLEDAGYTIVENDYHHVGNFVVIPIHQDFVDLTVKAKNDNIKEATKTIEFNLADDPSYDVDSQENSLQINVHDNDGWQVRVEALQAGVNEDDTGNGIFHSVPAFKVVRTGSSDTSHSLKVKLQTNGDATRIQDFVFSSPGNNFVPGENGYIVIPAGQTEVVIGVKPVDDSVQENDETIILEAIESPQFYDLEPGQPAAEFEIFDNDSNVVSLEDLDLSMKERSPIASQHDDGKLRIRRVAANGDYSKSLTVKLALNGEAQLGTDFSFLVFGASSNYLSFTIPENSEYLDISLIGLYDEVTNEGQKSFSLSVVDSGNYDSDASNSVDFLLSDNDEVANFTKPFVSISSSSAVLKEGSDQEDAGSSIVTIRRHGSSFFNQPLKVLLRHSGSATFSEDYSITGEGISLSETGGLVVIPAGQETVQLKVTPVNDDRPESIEDLRIWIEGSDHYYSVPYDLIPGSNSTMLHFEDNDMWTVGVELLNEGIGNSGGQGGSNNNSAATFRISRSGQTDLSNPLSVKISPVEGIYYPNNPLYRLSSNGFEYEHGFTDFSKVVIGPGESFVDIVVDPIGASNTEDVQDFSIQILESENYRISEGQSTVELVDQYQGKLTLTNHTPSGTLLTEGTDDTVILRVNRNGSANINDAVSFKVQLRRGEGISFNDVVWKSYHNTIPAGEEYVELELEILDDSVVESGGYFWVGLRSEKGGPSVDSRMNNVRFRLTDDDLQRASSSQIEIPAINIVPIKVTSKESVDNFDPIRFRVERDATNADTQRLTIEYSSSLPLRRADSGNSVVYVNQNTLIHNRFLFFDYGETSIELEGYYPNDNFEIADNQGTFSIQSISVSGADGGQKNLKDNFDSLKLNYSIEDNDHTSYSIEKVKDGSRTNYSNINPAVFKITRSSEDVGREMWVRVKLSLQQTGNLIDRTSYFANQRTNRLAESKVSWLSTDGLTYDVYFEAGQVTEEIEVTAIGSYDTEYDNPISSRSVTAELLNRDGYDLGNSIASATVQWQPYSESSPVHPDTTLTYFYFESPTLPSSWFEGEEIQFEIRKGVKQLGRNLPAPDSNSYEVELEVVTVRDINTSLFTNGGWNPYRNKVKPVEGIDFEITKNITIGAGESKAYGTLRILEDSKFEWTEGRIEIRVKTKPILSHSINYIIDRNLVNYGIRDPYGVGRGSAKIPYRFGAPIEFYIQDDTTGQLELAFEDSTTPIRLNDNDTDGNGIEDRKERVAKENDPELRKVNINPAHSDESERSNHFVRFEKFSNGRLWYRKNGIMNRVESHQKFFLTNLPEFYFELTSSGLDVEITAVQYVIINPDDLAFLDGIKIVSTKTITFDNTEFDADFGLEVLDNYIGLANPDLDESRGDAPKEFDGKFRVVKYSENEHTDLGETGHAFFLIEPKSGNLDDLSRIKSLKNATWDSATGLGIVEPSSFEDGIADIQILLESEFNPSWDLPIGIRLLTLSELESILDDNQIFGLTEAIARKVLNETSQVDVENSTAPKSIETLIVGKSVVQDVGSYDQYNTVAAGDTPYQIDTRSLSVNISNGQISSENGDFLPVFRTTGSEGLFTFKTEMPAESEDFGAEVTGTIKVKIGDNTTITTLDADSVAEVLAREDKVFQTTVKYDKSLVTPEGTTVVIQLTLTNGVDTSTKTVAKSLYNFEELYSNELSKSWEFSNLPRLLLPSYSNPNHSYWGRKNILYRGDGSYEEFRGLKVVENPEDSKYVMEFQGGPRYTFNSIGLITSIQDQFGRTTRFEYGDADSDQVSDELTKVIDQYGLERSYVYENGKLKKTVSATGLETSYNFDSNSGTVTSPPTGSDNSAQQFFSVTVDPNGMVTYTDGVGDITVVQDKGKIQIESGTDSYVAHTAIWTPFREIYPDESFGFSDTARFVDLDSDFPETELDLEAVYSAQVEKNSVKWMYRTDQNGFIIQEVAPLTPQLPKATTKFFVRDNLGRVVRSYIANGKNGAVTSVSDASTEYRYHPNGHVALVSSIIRPDGTKDVWEYDKRNEVKSYTEWTTSTSFFKTEYRRDGLVTKVFLGFDRLRDEVRNLDGSISYVRHYYQNGSYVNRYEYYQEGNKKGLLKKLIEREGTREQLITDYFYDSHRNLEKKEETYLGLVEGVDDAVSYSEKTRTTLYQYDALGQLILLTNPPIAIHGIAQKKGSTVEYEYDAAGRVKKKTRNNIHVTDYQYPNPNTTTVVGQEIDVANSDQMGTTVVRLTSSIVKNSQNRTVTETGPNGIVSVSTFDKRNNLLSVVKNDSGNEFSRIEYTYDHAGNIKTESRKADGENGDVSLTKTYVYDYMNRLLEVIDDNLGRTVQKFVYKKGRLDHQFDIGPNGLVKTQYGYDPAGRVKSITRPSGESNATQSFKYDVSGNLVETVEEGKITRYGVNSIGQAVTTFLPNDAEDQGLNNVTKVKRYNAFGELVTEISPGPNSTGQSTLHFIRNEVGLVMKTIGVKPNEVVNLQSETTPDVDYVLESQTYDLDGNIRTVKDAAGRITTYSYNKQGLVSEVLLSDNTSKTTFQYDQFGNIRFEKGTGGEIKRNDYNYKGQLILSVSPSLTKEENGETTNHYLQTSYSYNKYGSIDFEKESRLKKTSAGDVDSVVDSLMTNYTYDDLGRISYFQKGLDTRTTNYTATGFVDSIIQHDKGEDRPSTNYYYKYYDSGAKRSEKIAVSGKDPITKTFEYFSDGNLKKETDNKGSISTFEYNSWNLKVKETSYVSLSSEVKSVQVSRYWKYYTDGQLKEYTDRDGRIGTFEYDFGGNVSKYSWAGIENGTISRSIEYTPDGRVQEATKDGVVYRVLERDDLGREKKVQQILPSTNVSLLDQSGVEVGSHQQFNKTVNYTYDSFGNTSEIKIHDFDAITRQKTITQEFDVFGRRTYLKNAFGVDYWIEKSSYYVTGLIESVEYFVKQNKIREESFVYDRYGRITNTDSNHYSDVNLGALINSSSKAIAYSVNNNLRTLRKTELISHVENGASDTTIRTVDYLYGIVVDDKTNNLTGSNDQKNFYGVGSIETETVELGDRVLEDKFYKYVYDKEGNITDRIAKSEITLTAKEGLKLGILSLAGDWDFIETSENYGEGQFVSNSSDASFRWDLSSLVTNANYDMYLTWTDDLGIDPVVGALFNSLDSDAKGAVVSKSGQVQSIEIDFDAGVSSGVSKTVDGHEFRDVEQTVIGHDGASITVHRTAAWVTDTYLAVDAIHLVLNPNDETKAALTEKFTYDEYGNLLKIEKRNSANLLFEKVVNTYDALSRHIGTFTETYATDAAVLGPKEFVSVDVYVQGQTGVVDQYHYRATDIISGSTVNSSNVSESFHREIQELSDTQYAQDLTQRFAPTSASAELKQRYTGVFQSYLANYGDEGRRQLDFAISEGFVITNKEHWTWHNVGYLGKVISFDFSEPSNAVLANGLNATLNDIRFQYLVGGVNYTYYHVASYVHLTSLAEGYLGIDAIEQRELDVIEARLRGVIGGISVALTVATLGNAGPAIGALSSATKAAVAKQVAVQSGRQIVSRIGQRRLAMILAGGAVAGALDGAIGTSLQGGSLGETLVAAATGAILGIKNPAATFGGLGGGLFGYALGSASGNGATGYRLGSVAGSLGLGTGKAFGRRFLAGQGIVRSSLYAAKYARVHGSRVAVGAGIGGAVGGWEGAIMGAEFGDMFGSIAASGVKCFVDGTPVWVPSSAIDGSTGVTLGSTAVTPSTNLRDFAMGILVLGSVGWALKQVSRTGDKKKEREGSVLDLVEEYLALPSQPGRLIHPDGTIFKR